MLAFGIAVIAKAGMVQFVEGEKWLKLSDTLTLKEIIIEAERGNIYANDGRMLATTIPTFEVRMDLIADALTEEVWNNGIDSLCLLLENKFGEQSQQMWKAQLSRERRAKNRYFLLKKGLLFPELKAMHQWPLFRLGKYKSGMIVIQHNNRKMPFGTLAQRTIGYINDDNKIKIGLEGTYDKKLSGEKGVRKVQKLAGNVYIPLDDEDDLGAKPGYDLYTTIDINLQDVAENSLARSINNFKADHGSVVLMHIKTGQIRAIANLGKNEDNTYSEKYNYAVAELNEPGSVFKLASTLALLDHGYCDEHTTVDLENGKTRFYNRIMEDAHPKPGIATLKQVFQASSNVGISKLVYKHYREDREKFYNFLKKLKLTDPTGIDLSGEPSPDIHGVKSWSGISLPWISIGYEVRLTPLQILNLYATIANNGMQMKPYLVKEIKENDKTIQAFQPTILNKRVASEKSIQLIRSFLEGVVDSGTASNIRNNEYKIAGKTGTNLISDASRKYSDKVYQSTFVGYFPATNPEYACIVVINNPDKSIGYYGGAVSAPVFRDIADKIYATELAIQKPIDSSSNKNVLRNTKVMNHREYEIVSKRLGIAHMPIESPSEWVSNTAIDSVNVIKNWNMERNVMPSVESMSVKDALYVLENMGLKVQLVGTGKIKGQSIPAGTTIRRGIPVVLTLG